MTKNKVWLWLIYWLFPGPPLWVQRIKELISGQCFVSCLWIRVSPLETHHSFWFFIFFYSESLVWALSDMYSPNGPLAELLPPLRQREVQFWDHMPLAEELNSRQVWDQIKSGVLISSGRETRGRELPIIHFSSIYQRRSRKGCHRWIQTALAQTSLCSE